MQSEQVDEIQESLKHKKKKSQKEVIAESPKTDQVVEKEGSKHKKKKISQRCHCCISRD